MNGYSHVNWKQGSDLAHYNRFVEITHRLSREIDERLRRFFNFSLALLLLAPASVIMGVVFVLFELFDKDGGPFFYRGARLGMNAKPFNIYKIRTLTLDAEAKLGANLLIPGTRLERKFGTFLRRTRIDELPQLFNILKGDMNFVGPRPVRVAVSEQHKYKIRNYDLRFSVRPGLTGFSQFFTPHGTPKRIRAMVDNSFIRNNIKLRKELILISWTAYKMLMNTIHESFRIVLDYSNMLKRGRKVKDNRAVKRSKVREVDVLIGAGDGTTSMPERCHVVDISYSHLCIMSGLKMKKGEKLELVFEMHSNRNNKVKRAFASGTVEKIRDSGHLNNGSKFYVMQYEPVSNFNRYLVDQYVMHESVG